jgi:subtilisin family serine protease
MKKIIFLLTALLLSFTCFCQEIPKIDRLLQEEIQLRSDEELIKINIIMKAQYDQHELRLKADLYRSKEDKRNYVVNELKRHSRETQQEVMSYLNHFAENETVSDIIQFWIYNGVTCYATQEVIEALSYIDDILIIGFDKEYQCIPDYPDLIPEEGGREITYNVTKVNADQVWALGYKGEGIIVGVIDTGVNYNHHDLRDHMWTHPDFPYYGWNFSANNNNPMDGHSHGTHCAGTIAGDGTAGSQTGMAPNATIMALKVWNNSGSGTPAQMCAGFQFGVEHGAHVLSMSGGVWAGGSISERIQFRNTMINVLEAGVVASIAAGNEHVGYSFSPIPNQVRVPGNCPPPWLHPDQTTQGGTSAVVCVGATDNNDNIANFSSWGPVTWQDVTGYNDYPYNPGMGLIRPDVVAPGVNIKSCRHNNDTGYTNMDGTSMACPCVSGVMALMLSKNPDLTPVEICEILETTAMRLPNPSSPKGNTFGSGRIDAYQAVSAVQVCSSISNLTYILEYDKIVHLTWSRPEADTDLTGYNIYVNGVLVEGIFTVESFTYQASNEGVYLFCVVALYNENGNNCVSTSVCKTIDIISICEPASNLISNAGEYAVNLSWAAPELVSEILHYNIFRDGELVGTAETESFGENAPTGNYTYFVEVEYINGCLSDKISIEVKALEAPSHLTATPSEDVEVKITLSWEYEDEDVLFNIYRDENKIASNITGKQYTDTEVEIDAQYCYYVKATAEATESTASNTDCAVIVGIEEFTSDLKLYPNPTTGELIIENGGLRIGNVEVFDVFGKKINSKFKIQNSKFVIDISHLESGIYFIKIQTDQTTITRKIIKN